MLLLNPENVSWQGHLKGRRCVYETVISLPLLFRSSSTILGAARRAVQNTKTPMVISVAANGLNIILNYFLIYTLGLGLSLIHI